VIAVDPTDLTRPQLGELALGLVAPRPIAWVSTLSADGVPNLAPFSFFNLFSTAPATLAVGPGSRRGINKDSLANIRATGEFVVNVVTEELARLANMTSAEVEPSVDEWSLAGISSRASTMVAPRAVAESPASLECRVLQIVELSDDSELPTNALVIARVLCIVVDESVLDDRETYRVDPAKVALVARMGGDLWCRSRDVFELARPKT
jgi:flavin reductase (DIM6/NTAB) family NADH-FMN oxidoreductase RutF